MNAHQKEVFLLFDLANVLFSFDWTFFSDSVSGISDQQRQKIIDFIYSNEKYYELEKAEISKEEYFKRMEEVCDLQFQESYSELYEKFSKIFLLSNETLTILEILEDKDISWGYASNTHIGHFQYMNHLLRNDLYERKWGFYSFQMGSRKPEDCYFQKVKEALIDFNSVHFFDDTKVNVEASLKHGIKGHWVERIGDLKNHVLKAIE